MSVNLKNEYIKLLARLDDKQHSIANRNTVWPKKVLLVATDCIIVSSSPNNISVSSIIVGEFLSAKELLS